jgi:predicted O-linked N-acetylglucosamine transferase (SPINDLY family)
VLQQLCQIPEALAKYEQLIKLEPSLSFVRSHRLVAMNYLEPSAAVLEQAHRDFGLSLGPPVRSLAKRKITKLGILSPDLRAHSCAYFLEPLLRLKPDGLQVKLYYDHTVADKVTTRLAGITGHLASTAALSNLALEKLLLADELDLLVDLAGHFTRNRLELFARRVAPVQVTYLGYPNTTGVQAMDYRLADPKVDIGGASHFTEQLVYCPHGMWAYQPVPGAPDPSPAPAKPKFGYFGMLSKLSPQCLEAWATLVNQTKVPLLIKGDGLEFPHLQAYWQAKLAAAGFDLSLVELRQKTGDTLAHLQMYGEVTVALDPWPYNGTTTVCEALWQGVPTVALRGDRHASNVAAGLLDWAGLGHLAATTPAAYVDLAAKTLGHARLTRADLGQAGWLQHAKVADGLWQTVLTLGC